MVSFSPIEFCEVASGLLFPEGPVVMADGSIILVEIARGTLSRATLDGRVEVVANLGGGPNGAARGPDGAIYVCNNGGFAWHDYEGMLIPGDMAEDYSGGRIERVELDTGRVDVLYTACNGQPLIGPNDIVFDKAGGFWFTDLGKTHDRLRDRGALYYAKPDGSLIRECVYPMEMPNGVGLSPDEKTVFVAETITGRMWGFPIAEPGQIAGEGHSVLPRSDAFIMGSSILQFFDSLAVDAEGHVNVATIFNSGITRISQDGQTITHIPTDDRLTTNICFGGDDMKTAYITLSSSGRLVAADWPIAGLMLNYQEV
ncbi:MAG: SMP-30/gluconolactonase/LRE family protein [Parvularculales bacterium]